MPNALGIGLLGPLQVRDETGSLVHVGGRQLRISLTLLALNAGRVVPAGSLAGQLWPDDPPGNPGNALQTLVSRLRAELRQAGVFNPRRGAGEGGRGPGGDAGAGGVRGEPGPGRPDGVSGVPGGAPSWSCPVCAGADGGGERGVRGAGA